jgi:hypothetical protein
MHKHSTQLLMQHRQYKSEMGGFNSGSAPATSACKAGGVCSKRPGPLEPIRRWNSFHSRDRRSNTVSASVEHFRQQQQKLKNSILVSSSAPSASVLGAAAGLMGVTAGAGLGSDRGSTRAVPRVVALRSESADVPSPRGQHPPPPPAFPRRRFSVW